MRPLTALFTLALLAAPLAVEAQPAAAREYRIGYLCGVSCWGATAYQYPGPARRTAFQQALEERGYIDGRNTVIVYRSVDPAEIHRLPDLAAELVRLKVDIIFAAGDALTVQAAKTATRSVPIVMGISGDPVQLGLVASLARPGGNITGVTFLNDELIGKQVELLKETIPTISGVAVLRDPVAPDHAQTLRALGTATESLGIRLRPVELGGLEDPSAAGAKGGVGALVVLPSAYHYFQRSYIANLAIKRRLAAVSSFDEFVHARGLMSYGPNIPGLFRRAAIYVDKIWKGAKPADLPVEQPTKFELVINMRTAKALGLTIPPAVLARADEVIQ